MAAKEIIEYLFKGNPTDLLQAAEKVKNGLKGIGTAADKAAGDVNQSFSRMATGMQSAGQKMQTAGKALTVGVTLPLAYALKQMTDAAIEDQAAMAKLEGSLKRTTGATRAQLDEVNKFIDKTMMATAVADDDLRPAFERLARSTGSITQAQRQLNIAIDASRATGKDLSSITEAMAKANMGNVGALGRLGIGVRDANGEMLAMNDVLTIMEQKFRGASNDWMRTTAGQAELNKIKFGELQEQLGSQLVPVMEDLVQIAGFVIDKFMALPDWAQKVAIGMLLLKGPVLWLGGAGVKLIGDYVAKMAAMRVATEAIAASSVKLTGLTTASAAGLSAAGTAMGSNIKLTGGVLGFAGAIDKYAGAVMKLGTTLYVLNEGATFVTQLGDAIGKTGFGIQSFVDAVDAYAQSNSWQAFLNPVVLVTELASKIGLLPKPTQDATVGVESLGDKLDWFNQIVMGTPGYIDPAKQKLDEMAKATGWTQDELEALTASMETFTAELGFIDKSMAAEQAIRDLGVAIIEAKQAKDDDKTVVNEQQQAYDRLAESALSTARTVTDDYMTALQNGQLTEEQATQKKQQLLDTLNRVKAEVPQVAGRIDQMTAAVNRVPTRREINFEAKGMDAVREAARKLAADLQGINNIRFAATFTGQKLARNERGGVIPFAKGGMYMANSGGGITRGPMAVIGEGREPREYVIPTDPRFRDRALGLMNQASAELGVVRAQSGGSTFAPTINVSGAMDPQATASAVADAIEQAFARKKRRDGSLAFA